MKHTFTNNGRAMSMGAGLALGGAISMGITLLLSVLTAYLAGKGYVPVNTIGYFAMVILFLSAMAGAMTAQHKIKRLRLQVCLAAGGVYYASLILMTILLFGGNFTGMGATAAMVSCGSLISALLTNRQGRRKSPAARRRAAV